MSKSKKPKQENKEKDILVSEEKKPRVFINGIEQNIDNEDLQKIIK